MKFDNEAFFQAINDEKLGKLKAMLILKPEILHTAEPRDPGDLGLLEIYMQRLKIADNEDGIVIDDFDLLKQCAFEGLDYLAQKHGMDLVLIALEKAPFRVITDGLKYSIAGVEAAKKDHITLSSFCMFAVTLQKHLATLNYNDAQLKKLPLRTQKGLASLQLLCSVAELELIRVREQPDSPISGMYPAAKDAECTLITRMLSFYEAFALRFMQERETIAFEHIVVQAHKALSLYKAPHKNMDLYQELKQVLDTWKKYGSGQRKPFDYKGAIIRLEFKFQTGIDFSFEGKQVNRLVLVQTGSPIMGNFYAHSNRLVIHFKDKSTQIFELRPDTQYQSNFTNNREIVVRTQKVIKDLGGMIDDTLYNLNNRKVLLWKESAFARASKHDSPVHQFYKQAHHDVAGRIVQLLLRKNPAPKEVTLFSFGCGNGKELSLAYQRISENGILVKGFGFDINTENYKKAAAQHQSLVFAEGNVHDIEKSLSQQCFSKDSFKIGLFIGILTDSVIGTTVDALKAIQQTRELDYLYIEGFTHILLHERTLKAVGFNVIADKISEGMFEAMRATELMIAPNRFELSWMSDEERCAYLEKVSKSRSKAKVFDNLDLSFSANPLRDLKLFEPSTLKNIKSVDISWSYLKDDEIGPFMDLLAQIETPRLVLLLSAAQGAFEGIRKAAAPIKHIKLSERNDTASIDEVPAFRPLEARRWDIYSQLPNTRLKRLKL